MRHGVKRKKFNRTSAERDSLYRNLVQSLFLHERITTTETKAKAIKPIAEKLITKGLRQTLLSQKQLFEYLYDKDVARKVYNDISLRFKNRPGGYTRILKLGPRQSDGTKMAIIELVEKGETKKSKPETKAKKTTPKKVEKETSPEKENTKEVETKS